MTSLLGKCCPHGPSFISPNRWKSEGFKSGLYSGCGTMIQPTLAMRSTVFKLLWDLMLSCCKRKVVWSFDSEILSLQLSYHWNVEVRTDGLFEYQEVNKNHPFPIPNEGFYLLRVASWIFCSMGNAYFATPWTAVLTLALSSDTTTHHH